MIRLLVTYIIGHYYHIVKMCFNRLYEELTIEYDMRKERRLEREDVYFVLKYFGDQFYVNYINYN